MKRVFAVVFVIVLLISAAAFPIHANAEGSPVRNKRIVSVMYDDSGSMNGDSWISANYAMQAFAAMLNKNDELYISYMSDNESADPKDWLARRVDLTQPQQEIDTIRSHAMEGSTPIYALQCAFSVLSNSAETDPNTEFWLVAFTDGAFIGGITTSDVTGELKKYSDTVMPNGTKARIYFMTIMDSDNSYTPSDSGQNNIEIVSAKSTDDVTKNIFNVAAEISGRYKASDKDVDVKDSKTITVHSDLPLFSIGVVTQNSDAKVVKVETEEKQEVPIRSNVSIKAPGLEIPAVMGASSEALNMRGRTAVAGKEDETLPAGKYTVTFSEDIKPEDFVILFEPAIELRLILSKDGTQITDYDSIPANTSGLTAEAKLFEFGTDNEILPSLLPSGMTYNITHTEKQSVVNETDKSQLENINITDGESVITASVGLPGYFTLVKTISFTPPDIKITKVEASVQPDGSPRMKDIDGNPDGSNVVYFSDLFDNKTGVVFKLYEEDEPIDKQRAIALKSRFESGLKAEYNSFLSGGYEIEVQSDGTYLVYPHYDGWGIFYNGLIAWLLNHGEHEVKSTAFDTEASESLIFKLGTFSVLDIIKIILPIYIIIWILFKKHFTRATLICKYGTIHEGSFEPSYSDDDFVNLNWFGGFGGENSGLWQILKFFTLSPASVMFRDLKFCGKSSFFSKIRGTNQGLLVKKTNGKLISATKRMPTKVWKEPTLDMSNRIYKSDGTTFEKIYLD